MLVGQTVRKSIQIKRCKSTKRLDQIPRSAQYVGTMANQPLNCMSGPFLLATFKWALHIVHCPLHKRTAKE